MNIKKSIIYNPAINYAFPYPRQVFFLVLYIYQINIKQCYLPSNSLAASAFAGDLVLGSVSNDYRFTEINAILLE